MAWCLQPIFIANRVHSSQSRWARSRLCATAVAPAKEEPRVLFSTQQMLEAVPGGRSYSGLKAADRAWHALCHGSSAPPTQVITEVPRPVASGPENLDQYDVVVLGGTLGIFMATALLLRGYSVLVLERNQLRGRDQDWNISRADMKVFADLGVLTPTEVDDAISIEFNPVRIALDGSAEIETSNILNCGVSPRKVLDFVKRRFLDHGGALREGAAFDQATVYADAAQVDFTLRRDAPAEAGGAGGEGSTLHTAPHTHSPHKQDSVVARVIIDCMGAWSPIAAQARRGAKPDSVVLMVGGCASGLPATSRADLLCSFTPLDRRRKLQYFWEAFPAADGLTTYMFAYADPAPGRASLEAMYDDYLQLLPEYRGCADLEGVQIQRAVFGFVPNWHDQPLAPQTSRLLHIGDAAGNRSALSFAGFGAMARHLGRLTQGLDAALRRDGLGRGALALLQPHSPAISLTAAMQFSMGTRIGQDFQGCDENIINNYIGSSFGQMKHMGEKVYRPFMQDYLQFGSLARIVGGQLATRPGDILAMTVFMRSAKAGQMFATEFVLLGLYAALFRLARLVNPAHEWLLQPFPGLLYRWQRLVEAFQYGSALDYNEDEAINN